MNREWSNVYYHKALTSAQNAKLSSALRYTAIALGLEPADDRAWKLAGLCYYQLGQYGMAEHCLQQMTVPYAKWQSLFLEKQQEMNQVTNLVGQGVYKKAALYLAGRDKTIGEWNYLGCLYMVLRQRKKAMDCFSAVLEMDHENEYARKYQSDLEQVKIRKRWWFI